MNTTSKLEKDISDIEGHYYKCARRIRELLFDDSYKELGVYLNKHSDSIKNDLDLLQEKTLELSAIEDVSCNAIQLQLPF